MPGTTIKLLALAVGLFLVAEARGDAEFLPIVGILAADEATDAVVLRVAASDLRPLAFSSNARIGDAAYFLSDPRGTRGYFSNGIVNRFWATSCGTSRTNTARARPRP
jgi:hypothetical protein